MDEVCNYVIVYNIYLVIINELDRADDRVLGVFEVVDVRVSCSLVSPS